MDTLPRGRRLLLIAAFAVASAACNRAPAAPIGVSARTATAAPRVGGDTARASADPSPVPAGYATTYRALTTAPFASLGHAPGRYLVTVYANDAARVAYETGHAAYPAGAIFIAEHAEPRDAEALRGPVYMMEKRGGSGGIDVDAGDGGDAGAGAWRYVAIDERGRVADASTTALCAACHVDAPRDGVFLPR